MIVGIVGCGAIANTIVNELKSDKGIEIKYFYDKKEQKTLHRLQMGLLF